MDAASFFSAFGTTYAVVVWKTVRLFLPVFPPNDLQKESGSSRFAAPR